MCVCILFGKVTGKQTNMFESAVVHMTVKRKLPFGHSIVEATDKWSNLIHGYS